MSNRLVMALATSAVLLSAVPVFAQSAPGPAPGAAPDAPPAAAPVPPQAAHRMMERAAHRLQEAHDRLGITPAQEPQWDALVATMRDNWRAMRESPAAQALRSHDAHGVAALRAAADLARLRAEGMQHVIPAVETLYNVLTPQQRQMADRQIDRMVLHGGHRHG